jgi:cell division protein FtsA
MAKEIITGLDIGTSKIKVLSVSHSKNGKIELISKEEENSLGVRRGIVIEPEKISQILKKLFSKISKDIGQKIDSVYLNLGGNHLFSAPSRGLVSVSRADQKISEEDIQRVLEACQAIHLSSNKEIFNVIPKEFIIDGERGIKEPLGLFGVRLEVEALVLGGFSPYLENVKKAILDADLEILDMIPNPIAAARAVLTEKEKELGVALLDIGAGTTNLAVFEEGDLIHFAILPIGSSNITNDIAIGLKVDTDIAERIKIEYGNTSFKGKNLRQKIDIGEETPLIFSQKFLARIISDRVSEIFDEVNKELKKIGKEKKLPGGIVLTGGGAKLPKLIELAKEKFRLSSRIGKPKGILGLDEDPAFSTVCGLVLEGVDFNEKNFRSKGGILNKIKKIFKIFIP